MKERGQVLAGVVVLMTILLIMVPAIVIWLRQDARLAVKDQKSTSAFNFAEAAIDRGIWKLKTSTLTWETAYQNTVITGYNFDDTYNDVSGGTYRIKFSSGPEENQITITGEGRDNDAKETRAIKCVVEDVAVPGAIFSGAVVTMTDDFEVHWGPVLSHNNIVLNENVAQGAKYFPRKLSKQVVTSANFPRDINGLNPPNTDNKEWWSDYDAPELPDLNFTMIRSSADANGTLNICDADAKATHPTECSVSNLYDTNYPKADDNLYWYWDNPIPADADSCQSGCSTVVFTGQIGLVGTAVVRGNMTWDGNDRLSYTANVPKYAWKEYQKCDTSDTNEYPGDDGYHTSRLTFSLGSENASKQDTCWNLDAPNTDVAFHGFIYVGGDLNLNDTPDVHGALWVVGDVVRLGGSGHSLVFYDNKLINIPKLNVVLQRISWQEVSSNTQAWTDP